MMSKKLILDENMVNELINLLGEIPAKYSMGIINTIRATWSQQNQEDIEETEEKG